MIADKDITKRLLNEVWNRKFYYKQADDFIRKTFSAHGVFLEKLKSYSKKAQTILECGCGPATIIELICRKNQICYGIDISQSSINLAKERLKSKKNIKLSVGNIEKLSFPNNSFDLVYATAVFEHLAHPEKALLEMIRVTKKGGILIIMSPNFGSPFFPSFCFPNNFIARLKRCLVIIIKSHLYLLKKPNELDWNKVYPLALSKHKYQPDWDTMAEPYLQTLLIFIKNRHFNILENFSSVQMLNTKISSALPFGSLFIRIFNLSLRRLFFWIEKIRLAPYCYFGPDLFVVAKKM